MPDDAVGARVVYLREGAPADAAGTLAEPVGDLSRAIERAGDGGVVLVAPGTYRASVTLRGRHRVVGACAARVTLNRAPEDVLAGVFHVVGDGSSLTIEGVTIDTEYYNLRADDRGHIEGRRLILRGVHGLAEERRGSIDLQGVWAEPHPNPDAQYGPGDGGAFVGLGGSLSVRDAYVHGGWRLYTTNGPGSTATFENLSARSFRYGITTDDAIVRVRASSMDGVQAPVISAVSDLLDVDGLFVTHVASEPITYNSSIFCSEATVADLRHVRIEHDRSAAIRGGGAGTHVNLRDVAIVGQGDRAGSCVEVENEGTLDAARLRLERCGDDAIAAYAVANATLEDVYVRDPRITDLGDVGVGIAQVFGGTMVARRVRVEGAMRFGIAAQSLPPAVIERIPWERFWPPAQRLVGHLTRIDLEDVVVARSNPTFASGPAGVVAAAGTEVTARRLAITNQHGIGVATVDDGFNRELLIGALGRTLHLSDAERVVVALLLGPNLDAASAMNIDGLYVPRIDPWNVLVDLQNPTALPNFRASWGAYAAPGCSLTIRDATFDGEGVTDRAVVAGGAVSLDRAVISRYHGCALATLSTVSDAAITTHDTSLRANGGDSVCRETSLPRVRLPLSAE